MSLDEKMAELKDILLKAVKKNCKSIYVECDLDYDILDALSSKGFTVNCTVDGTKMSILIKW